MMDFEKRFYFLAIYNLCCELFHGSVFLGGSRRFGFFRCESDWDLFCLGNLDQEDKFAEQRLRHCGFKSVLGPQYPSWLWRNPTSVVDIVIIPDEHTYRLMEVEHHHIERMMKAMPYSLLTDKFRTSSLKGVEKYKILKTLLPVYLSQPFQYILVNPHP